MVPRRDIQHMSLQEWGLTIPHVYRRCPESPDDVFLCCKQFWGDQKLAQAPMLILPASEKVKLKTPGPTKACPPNQMTERALREFTKTATAIEKSPWNMKEAAAYLKMWCEANKAGEIPNPLPPGWVVTKQNSIPLWKDKPLELEWQKYAPGKPAPIQVAERRPEPGRGGRGRGRGGDILEKNSPPTPVR